MDVLYRRLGDDEMVDGPAVSESANALLLAASRAGTVSVVNTPGNGVADDKAIYAFVHTMIGYYLGEEPLIGDVGTWVLADPDQYEGVRDRLRRDLLGGGHPGPRRAGGSPQEVDSTILCSRWKETGITTRHCRPYPS